MLTFSRILFLVSGTDDDDDDDDDDDNNNDINRDDGDIVINDKDYKEECDDSDDDKDDKCQSLSCCQRCKSQPKMIA